MCTEQTANALKDTAILRRLNEVIDLARRRDFYRARLREWPGPVRSTADFESLPILSKSELIPDDPSSPAKIFDLPPACYVRGHQTSGSRGFPMGVRDTAEDWSWWLDCWDQVLDAAGVSPDDVAMMAFSFGPFIGFWTANDALVRRGVLVIPGGGMPSETRLKVICEQRCTVVCCTPTYALHLANVAERSGFDLVGGSVRIVIVAGEPGGSIPAVRAAIESAWGAKVVDHAGGSEIGAWGFGDPDGKGLHVIESEFIAEVLDFSSPVRPRHVSDGETGELVLTNLGRRGGPAIRYRTGDLVRPHRHHEKSCPYLWLEGGVLGRADDMLIIRGVNIYPSSVDAIIREIDSRGEYRVTVTHRDEMDQISIELESSMSTAEQLKDLFRDRLAMRVDVATVPRGTLPRFEAKSGRWIDRRERNVSR